MRASSDVNGVTFTGSQPNRVTLRLAGALTSLTEPNLGCETAPEPRAGDRYFIPTKSSDVNGVTFTGSQPNRVTLRLAGALTSLTEPNLGCETAPEPRAGDRYFVPAKLFKHCRSLITQRGRGWEATVQRCDTQVVIIVCDGDSKPSRLPLSQLRTRCTWLSSRKRPREVHFADMAVGDLTSDLEQKGFIVLADALSTGLTKHQRHEFTSSDYWRAVRDGDVPELRANDTFTNFSGLRWSLPAHLPRIRTEILTTLEKHGILQGRVLKRYDQTHQGNLKAPPDEAYAQGLTLLRSDPGAPDQHCHADRGSPGDFAAATFAGTPLSVLVALEDGTSIVVKPIGSEDFIRLHIPTLSMCVFRGDLLHHGVGLPCTAGSSHLRLHGYIDPPDFAPPINVLHGC